MYDDRWESIAKYGVCEICQSPDPHHEYEGADEGEEGERHEHKRHRVVCK